MLVPLVSLKRFLLFFGAIFLLMSVSGVKSASPSLFYSLLPLSNTKNECLNRAYRAIAAEMTGSIIQRADDVALVNSQYNLAVHCRRTGDRKSFATIIVTHQIDFNLAKQLALNIQHRMESAKFD